MLAPDVIKCTSDLKFQETLKSGRLDDPNFKNDILKELKNLRNCCEVKIVHCSQQSSPSPFIFNDVTKTIEEGSEFITIEDMFDVSILFDNEFKDRFLHSGELCLSSIGTSTFTKNSSLSLSNNILSLSVQQDEMLPTKCQNLFSKFLKDKSNKYHYQQDISYHNNKTLSICKKVVSSPILINTSLRATLTWSSQSNKSLTSTLAAYLQDKKGIKVNRHKIKVTE